MSRTWGPGSHGLVCCTLGISSPCLCLLCHLYPLCLCLLQLDRLLVAKTVSDHGVECSLRQP